MLEAIASILIDLSDQKLYVYNQNNQVVRTVLVSTGKAATPTPTGEGAVLSKHRTVTMRGRGYVAPGVPWALCVSDDGSICLHGAPWQEAAGERFGVPRSHGCVRIPSPHARWLYENTPVGTPVKIQA
ncbi:MAG: L,D-transpeptidase [Synechococcaceae cyanobacterium]|nr:L,D-transpeptidase [Synechococcaceae cyanobacterium]